VQSIQTAREQLSALVQELKKLMHVDGVAEIHTSTKPLQEPLEIWDEIVYEPVPGGDGDPILMIDVEDPEGSGSIQIEDQVMPLPSNGNVGPEYAQIEISHRITHADNHLNRIRDLIAEKSFQFSHVIRVAPRKNVNTRSRAEVKKLNLQISVQCRLYMQCRARLIKLGAPQVTTNRFQVLTINDIKASTAIVNPNERGSTQLKLSWIWQTSGGHRWGLAAGAGAESNAGLNVIECEFFFLFFLALYF
jgi:hypothetical protein